METAERITGTPKNLDGVDRMAVTLPEARLISGFFTKIKFWRPRSLLEKANTARRKAEARKLKDRRARGKRDRKKRAMWEKNFESYVRAGYKHCREIILMSARNGYHVAYIDTWKLPHLDKAPGGNATRLFESVIERIKMEGFPVVDEDGRIYRVTLN